METLKITNGLLAIIAVCLICITLKLIHGSGLGPISVVPSASAQAELDLEDELPLYAICTLSQVDEAAAKTLVGGFQNAVISTLNQTNSTLWDLQLPLVEMQRSLLRMETEMQQIAKNTRPY